MSAEMNRPMVIAQLGPLMKNINLSFIVIDIGHSRRTPQGHDVRTVRVADATGSISMGVWDELGGCISTGDIWRLRNGYTTVYKGTLNLSCGKLGDLQKTGEFFMLYSELPNMSEFSAELAAKYPTLRKGSPDEDVNNGQSGNNGSSAQNAPSGNSSATQKSQQSSTQRPIKRTGSLSISHTQITRRVDLPFPKNPRLLS